MQRRMRTLLPAPIRSPDDPHAETTAESSAQKKRRSGVSIACNFCRNRKSACDGKQPACTPCFRRGIVCTYVTKSANETYMEALKRQNEALRSNEYALLEILDLLKSDSDERSMTLVRKLKASNETDTTTLLEQLKQDVTAGDGSILDQLEVTNSAGATSQSSAEINLMLRHPVAYPALAQVDLPSKFLHPLPIRLAKVYCNGNALLGSGREGLKPIPTLGFQTPEGPSATMLEESPSPYCDNRLANLRIIQWTSVPVTDEFAAGAISLFLKTDHPILGIFDAELFIRDLIEPRLRFCSPLLVNSLLYWACQAYASFEPRAIAYSEAFFNEADSLWSVESQNDSLNAVAASQFLSLGSVYYGKNAGLSYWSQGIQMAQRMKLFGVPDTVTEQTLSTQPHEWVQAMSHTAWGAYNWAAMRSLQFQEQDLSIRYPPTLAIPGLRGGGLESDNTARQIHSHPLPSYTGDSFPALCELWSMASQWILLCYKDGDSSTASRVSQEYAECMFQNLLSWSDKLPNSLARGDESTDHSLIIHIFRPFTITALGVATKGHTTHTDPIGPFTASLKQLKHLVRIFDCRYPSSTYSILWHVALLQVANAMVNEVDDPDSLGYFLLCVACYRDLFTSYRVVYSIVKGLLSMARRKGAMSALTAQLVLEQLQKNGKHHTALDNIRATFVVDLDLALTDTRAAQAEALANDFDAMAIFDVLTVSTDYIASSSADTRGHNQQDIIDGS
ncbi:fungal zn(2)-Cys(6) binuclear cluster domain-containing protein [Pochonia chlamydosporia 170]|uniref:Fungal zn(2)-Cys(6) binuclear cluster domain-containing protein n=1 Tax=Pochonia chlamydosporia 170 TaxID=1380566 RepID=A0A179F6V1_METCM|nr:fungal zn(2)-Cys(6) binuclear cluster domain-containing protein [Pochonia chlamydosporia 170]OAQ60883.2 fungal zn(2)-Cys(6) binuclear cluster domain-containing protein [Pochonia chlamydosporia 170]